MKDSIITETCLSLLQGNYNIETGIVDAEAIADRVFELLEDMPLEDIAAELDKREAELENLL